MRQLLIIVYKINVSGFTRQYAEELIRNAINSYDLSNDEELKEDYIIRQIFLPSDEPSDVKVIYPINASPKINELINDISEKVEEYQNSDLKKYWLQLVRELKLRKINEC